MHVLVFTPVYRLEPETVEAIFGLEYDGPISYLFQRDNPTGDGRQDVLHQYQLGRKAFLNGPYGAMLVVESDIIPPPDALKKLLALECDLAYGVYVFRQSSEINVFERYPQPARNVGEPLTAHPGRLKKALRQGVVECSGAGLGCVLIKRHVLRAVDFRLEQTAHCDTYFTRDVYGGGYSMKADLSVVCGHKREDGEVLWPRF